MSLSRSVVTLREARDEGLQYYWTGVPCKHGHIAERLVANSTCLTCKRASGRRTGNKRWADPEYRAQRSAYEKQRWQNAEHRKRHLERMREPTVRLKRLAQAAEWKLRNRKRATDIESRRQAKKAASFVEDVPMSYLIERDHGICQLCGLAVDPNPISAADAASRDHIIPLAKGGTHERRNLQLAHRRCNSGKRDRITGQEMLKVG